MLVIGLVLMGLGVSVGAWIAVVGIVVALLANLFAPWPWKLGWRDW